MINALIVRDASLKTGVRKVWNVRPHFGRSVMRTREGRAAARGFSELNGLFLLPSRIGSVIREQRPAAATTRTTGCSLKFIGVWCKWRRIDSWNDSAVKLTAREIPAKNSAPGVIPEVGVQTRPRPTSENIRWSSSPRPVKQAPSYRRATKGEARRE